MNLFSEDELTRIGTGEVKNAQSIKTHQHPELLRILIELDTIKFFLFSFQTEKKIQTEKKLYAMKKMCGLAKQIIGLLERTFFSPYT